MTEERIYQINTKTSEALKLKCMLLYMMLTAEQLSHNVKNIFLHCAFNKIMNS